MPLAREEDNEMQNKQVVGTHEKSGTQTQLSLQQAISDEADFFSAALNNLQTLSIVINMDFQGIVHNYGNLHFSSNYLCFRKICLI